MTKTDVLRGADAPPKGILTMTKHARRLITLAIRFQNRVDAARYAAAEVYEMDSRVDGGEFSGPAIERDLARERDRIAQRLGFASADLAYDVAKLVGAITRWPAHVFYPTDVVGPAPIPSASR